MCITRRKIRQKKKTKKYSVHPLIQTENMTTNKFLKECITCYNCKNHFNLASNEIKIHCAGCHQFFHCGIAGRCRGDGCNGTTVNGEKHSLSWCVSCVSAIKGNEEKINGEGTCICRDCLRGKIIS